MEIQGRLFPKLVQLGVIPRKSKAEVERLATAFEQRFLKADVQPEALLLHSRHWEQLAACYLRYSCDKSNPRSLVQQLKLTLERAAANKHFIPWQFVFADAAVTGTTADRHGYELANLQMASTAADSPVVLYIDEIGRASRDMVEALRLGRMIDAMGKRLVGVSDGFDSDHQMWKFVLSIFAALQEWFIDQLKPKVKRGMRDAHRQGTNLRPAAVGYKLVPAVDATGSPIFGKDGVRSKMLAVDEKTMPYIQLAFNLYVTQNWSLGRIARHLNDLAVIGCTWDSSRVRQLLGRYKYAGIDVEDMTYRAEQLDEKGRKKYVIKRNPREKWKVRRARNLQIIPWSVWKAAQRRLELAKNAYSKSSSRTTRRDEVNATTLVRPLCGGCKKPLWLGRAGKHASFTCTDARDGKNGCTFRGYKTVRHVENAVVNYVLNKVLTPTRVNELVERANQYLIEQSEAPRVDTTAWETEIAKLSAGCKRLAKVLANEDDDQKMGAVVAKLRQDERRLAELRAMARDAKRSSDIPARLCTTQVLELIKDVSTLLQSEVQIAAPLLRQLTGPITLLQEKQEGKSKPAWFACFTYNLLPVLLQISRNGNCPTTSTLEYLTTHGWTNAESAKFPLDVERKADVIAAKVAELVAEGHSTDTIAAVLGVSSQVVQEARTGRKRARGPRGKTAGETAKAPRTTFHDLVAPLKALLVKEPGTSISEAARRLGYCEATVRCAYDAAFPEVIEKARVDGAPPQRSNRSRLSKQEIERVKELLRKGVPIYEIEAEIGCSRQTVYRIKSKM